MDMREKKLRSRVIYEYLIRWNGLLIEDAIWEGEQALQWLENKKSWEGRIVRSLSNP